MSDIADGTSAVGWDKTREIADRVEAFVRDVVIPYEKNPRRDHHDAPTDELIFELREKAVAAGVMTPHIMPDGRHLSQRQTALVLRRTGLSPLGPPAMNTAAPDEGNMYLLGKVGSPQLKERFRIYDGPTEVHKWSLAKKIKRDWKKAQESWLSHP